MFSLERVDPSEEQEPQSGHRYRKLRLWWVLLFLLIAAGVWLNGPGLRWLGPVIVMRELEKMGLRGSFEVEGDLARGLSLKNVELEGDETLAELRLESVIPEYSLRRLLRGEVQGLTINGAHLALRFEPEPDRKDATPLDPAGVLRQMRLVRSRLVPLNLDIGNFSLNATLEGKQLLALDDAHLRHEAGSDLFQLGLGTIQAADGERWASQPSSVVWAEESLTVDRLDALPGIGVRDLSVSLPDDAAISLDTQVLVGDAVFQLGTSPGLQSLQLSLLSGDVELGEVAKRFDVGFPADGRLSSLMVTLERLEGGIAGIEGSAQVLIENAIYQEMQVPEVTMDFALAGSRATLAARGTGLGNEFGINIEAAVSRERGSIEIGETRGDFHVGGISGIINALAARYGGVDQTAPVPPSLVDGNFVLRFEANRPVFADGSLVLAPVDSVAVAPLTLNATWHADRPMTAVMAAEGVRATAELDFTSSAYEAEMVFDGFRSRRIDPWLAIGGAATPGALVFTGTWRGSGVVTENIHRGSLVSKSAEFVHEGIPSVHAEGEIDYEWPGGFSTRALGFKTEHQTLRVGLKLQEGFLDVSDLVWEDSGIVIATGKARLPVPDGFGGWRETLLADERQIDVQLKSQVLPLQRLQAWVATVDQLDPGATGMLDLKVAGTFSDPVVDLALAIRGLRPRGGGAVPPMDLDLTLAARDGLASVAGTVTAPDLPPAELGASMAFHPVAWAEKPELLLDEAIAARIDLPRLELERFSALVPAAKKLAGVVTGHAEVGGTLGEPVAKGQVRLNDGVLDLRGNKIPMATGITATADLTKDRVAVTGMKADIAAGTLTGNGSVMINDGRFGAMDFQVRGDHVPVRRDGSLILRTSGDLRLTGTWDEASVSGNLDVVDSLFFRDVELLPIGRPFTVPRAAKLPRIDPQLQVEERVPEPFRDWSLNVLVRTVDPFVIRGNLARGRIDGSVRVRGSIGAPAPDGELTVSKFRAELPFTTVAVRKGTIRFTPEAGFDPLLELRGVAEPRPYRVDAYVYGRASDPQLILTSSPPLPENEIMTLLATGTTTAGLEDPQAASNRALQLLLEELRRGRFGVGKQLRPLLKVLDKVDFALAEEDPYSSESYTTATLKLHERWYLTAGLGEAGDSRLLAIWRLRFH